MPTLVGDLTIREVPGTTLSVNEFGMDEIARVFMGYYTYVSSFIRNLKGSRDSEYPQLTCTDYSVSYRDGGMAEITATYKGLLSGIPRDPVIINETAINNIELFYNVGNNSTPFSADYYAPKTTYRYTRNYRPLTAEYGVIQSTGFSILPFNPRPRVVNLEAQRVTRVVTKDYVTSFRNEKQGEWYECEETIERKLYDFTAVDF